MEKDGYSALILGLEDRREKTTKKPVLGQFKTPPLRGVADLSRWGHGGAAVSLASVTIAYGKGGVPAADPSSAGAREPWLVDFGETVQWGLVPFLQTLRAEPLLP